LSQIFVSHFSVYVPQRSIQLAGIVLRTVTGVTVLQRLNAVPIPRPWLRCTPLLHVSLRIFHCSPSLGVKRPEREANYSHPSSAEVTECMELYLHYHCNGGYEKHKVILDHTLIRSCRREKGNYYMFSLL